MADFIQSGRQWYAANEDKIENYKRALTLFTRAMRSCPCARGLKRGRCTCKDFEKVASQQNSIYREAMYTCHCDVGRSFSKCDNLHHIEALDLRAATFVAMGLLGHAMKDAEWILELAPQLPDGYLRLGNIAHLQENDDFAWKMYTSGIEANQNTTVESSPKLLQLYEARKPLNRLFFRQDPLYLPAEIVTQIFSCLACDELLHCLGVSKQWAYMLTSPIYAPLWRDMTFSEWGGGPSNDELRKMLSWAGDGGARKIVTQRNMALTDSMLTMLLEASPSLEHLEFLDLPVDLCFPLNRKTWNRLRYFSFKKSWLASHDRFAADLVGELPHSFLQNAASSLEHLEVTGIPAQWYDEVPLIPHLPNLKILRMSGTVRINVPFPMYPLSIAFPSLEQLFIGPGLSHLDPAPLSIWRERRQDIWPHLKVLIFELNWPRSQRHVDIDTRLMLHSLMCLNRGKPLQHIRFHFEIYEYMLCMVSGIVDSLFSDFDDDRALDFQNLRSFSSNLFCLSPKEARTLLSNAIQTKRLTSFDINFPEHTGANHPTSRDLSHLRSYEWARGAPSIQEMGLYHFHFWQYPEDHEHHPLAEFVATFPNLRTLSICSLYYDWEQPELARLVDMILRVTHLETIYMKDVNHTVFAQLRQAAQQRGVRLMDISYRRQYQWPVRLEA
ncbi:uncharacterized protein CPUR_04288 [Claviceps purpurea 20.1]|uniref:F-box domain-containing protein n=1 Tax=Claviceps purpurea (strain 20.1) TaxID=1111077 RepID=M1W6C7_CLAP2|nr:uncharacterized protein CPUR_04288 [Claviceps purpurea 20.1]